jgi:hypothetical protein
MVGSSRNFGKKIIWDSILALTELTGLTGDSERGRDREE